MRFVQFAKLACESQMRVGRYLCSANEDHQMIEQRLINLIVRRWGNRLRKIDAGDLRADGRSEQVDD